MANDSQPPASGSNVANAIEEDSEWEYEYHETETETFYVTVDLSSSSTNIRPRERRDPPDSITADSPPSAEDNESVASPVRGPTLDSSDAVQILDFHTPNPLISYQGRLYSCTWSTTIGTDLLLTPSKSSDSPILAASRIKLSGRPVRMTRHHGASKPSLQPPDNVSETQNTTVEPIPPEIDSLAHPPGQGPIPDQGPILQRPALEIPLDKHASLARRNQAHFLERLSAIKAARGEPDEVTVYAKKRYTGTGWRSRQRIERDMGDGEDEGDDTAAMGGGDDDDDRNGDEGGDRSYRRTRAAAPPLRAHQRKPRSRGRGRRGGAGLFRDYRPSKEMTNGGGLSGSHGPGDEQAAPPESDPGADMSVPTPQNWNELIDPRIESTGHSPVAASADPATGSLVATEKGVGNQDKTGDVVMEDV